MISLLLRSVLAKAAIRLVPFALALVGSSCVSLVTPEQSAISVQGRSVSPVGIAVTDHRTNTASLQKDRYYGRCRLAYGIPSPILDPKMSVAERLTRQLEAGFHNQGTVVRTSISKPFTNSAAIIPTLAGCRKVLLVRLDDVWIDFANPLGGNESILYFNASAQVLDPSGKVLASTTRNFERNFRYDINDSLFNQAVLTLQPEFKALVNQPSISRALAP